MNIRELQLATLKILQATVKFLEAEGLNYSISCGTLLGAIRHKGFIPWDDDIDISMPRADYNRLQAILKQKGNHLTDNMYFHSYEQKNLHLPFTKVYDYSVRAKDERYSDKYEKYLWVDIFPIDNMPPSVAKTTKLFQKIDFYRELLATKKKTLRTIKGPLAKARKVIQRTILLPIPARFIAGRMVKLAERCNAVSSEFAGVVVWGIGPRERMPKTVFEYYTTTEFEHLKFKCFKDYRNYLTYLYGDYMKLPPKSQRVTHHIEAWRVADEK